MIAGAGWIAVALAAAHGDGPPVDVAGAYAGEWHTHIDYRDTPYSHARSETVVLQNTCWRGEGGFQVCQQRVDGKPAALLVYRCGARQCSVFPIEGATTQVRANDLLVDAGTWTFPWQETHAGHAVHFRVVNTFRDRDTIAFRSEYSDDGVHWLPLATGTERRVR